MIGVLSLFVIITLSLLITRIAAVALMLTGLSRESARFQARSAFTGTGFTTTEAETVVDHPVRRRIVMALMMLGSAGTASVVASLLLSFTGLHSSLDGLLRLSSIAAGLLVLLLVLRSPAADRALTVLLQRLLRRYTDLDARDYDGLLHLSDNWMVGELKIREGDWIADHPLRDLDLPAEGVLVLGIQRRTGQWIGAPQPTTYLHAGDVTVLYGPRDVLDDLDDRRGGPSGEHDHAAARARFQRHLARQDTIDQPRT